MKVNLNVGKKFTINTGNYSSIQPSVSLTISDIDVDDVTEVHGLLETISSGLLLFQISEDSELMKDFQTLGMDDFFKQTGGVENIEKSVNESIEKLKKYSISME